MLKLFAMKIPPLRRLVEERDALRMALTELDGRVFDSPYDRKELFRSAAKSGNHRDSIGGLWDEVGKLQIEFLISKGLKPSHKLIDIGCGSLRGGVHYVKFLESGNYWGVDLNQGLLDAGWEIELASLGLQAKQPRAQLVCLEDFEFATLGEKFDFAVAISVFTHLSFNRIRRCLTRLAPVMTLGGKLYATFFECPIGAAREKSMKHDPGGIESHSFKDPFHYTVDDFEHAVSELPFTVHYVGGWKHPRDQKMIYFEKT